MKISYNWLRQYIDCDLSPYEMTEILTDIGLEVEGTENFQSVKGGLEGVIIGEVLSCEKHPNADKLSTTTVNIGYGEPLKIVCGAPNVAAGQKVPVATVGTTLYVGDKNFEIKRTKIRGEESEGMICAEDELGLGDSHDGIMVLDDQVKPGTMARDYFRVESDVVIEIGLTPNRIDGASHYGVARDLAAFLSQKKEIRAQLPDVDAFDVENKNTPYEVIVENQAACPRYSGVSITNITVEESPDWLKNRLKAIGLNPINNVVDITNYVLHEVGQPLHAFDGDKIQGNKVMVKTLEEGATFVTLDEEERKLSADDLMICDEKGGMCIAGVFGGIDSGVTETTNKIFLESACFDAVYVRKTAKRHGLSTDASFRFERGTDPDMTLYALKRAALLIKEIAGGVISSDIVDIYPEPVKPFEVELSLNRTTSLIGKDLGKNTILSILQSLEIEVVAEEEDLLKLKVPPYRVDVQREADVIEEILRIYGYNNVEIGHKLNTTLTYERETDKQHKLENKIGTLLASNGFHEIMCNSLTKSAYYEAFDPEADRAVHLFNPLSADLNVYRKSLLFGGLEAIIHNINRQRGNLQLFEFGYCYEQNNKPTEEPLSKYHYNQYLGLFLHGKMKEANWITPDEDVSFYALKGYVQLIMEKTGIKLTECTASDSSSYYFSTGLTIKKNGKLLADIGLVDRKILKHFDIDTDVYYASIHWGHLMELRNKARLQFQELPKYPEVRRDLALLVDKKVRFEDIEKLANKSEKKLLQHIDLFDVYENEEKLGKDKKSYAVSFVFQDLKSTLTDKQIDKIMNQMMSAFEKELNAQIR